MKIIDRLAKAWVLFHDLRDQCPIEYCLLPKTHPWARKIAQARRRIDGLSRRAKLAAEG